MLKPILRENLDVLFVGFNPHPYSLERGRYYAHGSLWRIMRKADLGEIYDDSQLLDHNYGITDLVQNRPTREAKEISDADYARAVVRFRRTLARLAPRITCFTGKGVYRHFAGLKANVTIEYGLQAEEFDRTKLYVVPFPSHKWMTDAEKVEHYRGLRVLLKRTVAPTARND